MSNNIIKYSHQLGYSRLFRDFVNHPDQLADIFKPIDAKKLVTDVAARARYRESAVEILLQQNRKWKAPPPVMENILKLNDKNSIIVVAGQQACLFGGPYLVIVKALAAIRLAQKLENELSIPVVPVFWIAADDHDFQEISSTDIFDSSGSLMRLMIDYNAEKKYPPIGAMRYDDSIRREIERLTSALPDNDFRSETLKPISDIYRPNRKIVDCFAEYMLALIGNLGIALFNPYDEGFKRDMAPIMQGIVSRIGDIKNVLAKTESRLQSKGYHIQVQKAASAAHLFYHAPGRTAIHRDGDKFKAGAKSFSEKELVDAIAASPRDFSPDVLTRPLVQSSFFPTAAVIAGPAEVAYYAQLMPLFDIFDLSPPLIVSRPSMTLVEKRFEKLVDSHHITLEDLAGDIEAVINRVLKETVPEKLSKGLTNIIDTNNDGMNKLQGELAEFDQELAGAADRAKEKIDYQLRELCKKVLDTHKRKNNTEQQRIYRLQQNLFPNGGLAERSIAPAYLISRYGRKVIEFLLRNMIFEETGHQLLMLSEYHG